MQEKSDVRINILWNTFGTIFYCIAQWAITILVVRLDSFGASGQLSLAMTTSSSFAAISLFSMRNYQVSDVDAKYKTMHYVGSRVITCVLAFVLCMIYGMLSSYTMYQMGCVAFFMVVRIAEAIVDVLHGIDQKYEKYDIIGKSYIARGIVTVAVFSVVLIITHDMLITLAFMAVGNLAVAIFWDIRETWKLERLTAIIKDKQVATLLFTCVPLAIFSFFLSMENLWPKTVLQNMYGEEALGIYASIASPTLVVQVGAQVVFSPLLPSFTRVYNDGEYKKFRDMFHKVLIVLVGVCVFVAIAAAIVGRWGLNLLYGEVILEYYELFMPIVFSTIGMALIWVLQAIVIGIREIYPMLLGIVIDFLICYFSCGWFLEKFGWNGASFVQIVCLFGLAIYLVLICELNVHRKFNAKDGK